MKGLLLFLVCLAVNGEPYRDVTRPVAQRVEDLLGRMTLEEKVAQLQNRFVETDTDFADNFQGLSWGTVFTLRSDVQQCRDLMDRAQRYALDSTRLGIPMIPCAEGIQGILMNGATIFPHALAQGSCFNPSLVCKMAVACAEEARQMGIRQVLSPVLELARDPRWGRVEETYGEDPFLVAENAVAFVKGYQSEGVACTAKHFIAHGSPTGGLNCASVSGGPRELRSLYMYPFARVIAEASPWCVMSCYSSYDGVAVTGSRYYMTDLLRGELGFDGYTYSDWGAVERLENYHHAVASLEEAARMALEAGVDVNVFNAYSTLASQVEAGTIDVALVDEAVRRVLRVKFELGLFEEPFSVPQVGGIRSAAHVALSKEISDESVILLKNNGLLPLDPGRYRRIAVIGPNAAQTVFGDYAWPDAFAQEGVSLLDALRSRLSGSGTAAVGSSSAGTDIRSSSGAEVLYAEGCDWWSRDDSRIAEAAALAASCDLAIVAVGSRSTFLTRKSLNNTSGEGNDLSSLDLPGCQQQLLEAVAATGKPLVVVLISGKPFAMPWVKEHADAFLVQWYGGEEQGSSLADVLLGRVNPSGRLNVSFPRSTGNLPCFYNYLPTDREYYGGHGGSYDAPRERYVFELPYALWNFGDGMGYSSFEYVYRTFERRKFKAGNGGSIRVEVAVENHGPYDGKEVVQLYVRDLVSSVATPVKQLKAFGKALIPVGGRALFHLEVPLDELSLVDAQMRRVLEPGEFEIQIGPSSDRIMFRDTVVVRP